MSLKKIDDTKVVALANSMRTANGLTSQYALSEIPDAINAFKASSKTWYSAHTSKTNANCVMPAGSSKDMMFLATAYVIAGEQYRVRYTDGSLSPIMSQETTGLVDIAVKVPQDNRAIDYNLDVLFISPNAKSCLMKYFSPVTSKCIVEYCKPTTFFPTGTTVYTETVEYGTAATYNVIPPDESDDTNHFHYTGWHDPDGNLQCVTRDMVVQADVIVTPIYYTVRFYNGPTLLYTTQVQYGQAATYRGQSTSSLVDPQNRSGYKFRKWDKDFSLITQDTDINAIFWGTYNDEEITDSWSTIVNNCETTAYRTEYSVGMWKTINMDGYEMKAYIVGVDADTLTAGGTAPLSFMCDETGHSGRIHSSDYMGGYESCNARSTLNSTVKNSAPYEIRSKIKQVKKEHNSSPGKASSNEYVWFPSMKELGVYGANCSLYGATYNHDATYKVMSTFHNNTNDFAGYEPNMFWTRDSGTMDYKNNVYITDKTRYGYWFAYPTDEQSGSSKLAWLFGFCL